MATVWHCKILEFLERRQKHTEKCQRSRTPLFNLTTQRCWAKVGRVRPLASPCLTPSTMTTARGHGGRMWAEFWMLPFIYVNFCFFLEFFFFFFFFRSVQLTYESGTLFGFMAHHNIPAFMPQNHGPGCLNGLSRRNISFCAFWMLVPNSWELLLDMYGPIICIIYIELLAKKVGSTWSGCDSSWPSHHQGEERFIARATLFMVRALRLGPQAWTGS